MNYSQTIDFLFSRLPMFQKKGRKALNPGLENILHLLNFLDNPHLKFPTIHIAGTNGKGTVAHLLASVFQSAGYKTGLYTSPHFKDFRERIKINGQPVSKAFVVDFVARTKPENFSFEPSFFEYTTAMCFHAFASEKVDIAIVETGLGGRLDCTNVIKPEISIITSVHFDHQNILGNTLAKIAAEKAGIIKQRIPLLVGKLEEEALSVISKIALEKQSEVFLSQEVFENAPEIMNQLLVKKAVHILAQGGWSISEKDVEQGIENVVGQTGFYGRFQIEDKIKPIVIYDIAHNEQAVKAAIHKLNDMFPDKKYHIIWGMSNDKDIAQILKILPQSALFYFTRANVPRASNPEIIMGKALEIGLNAKAFTSVEKAFFAAKKSAAQEDIILVGGSFFVVAEALPAF